MENNDNKIYNYDCIMTVIISNLRSIAKDNTISIGNFDTNNQSHLCIYHAARIAHDLFGLNITIDTNWIKFLIFIRKFKCKNMVKKSKNFVIDCNKLVNLIEEANGKGILIEIYNEFYR